MKTIGTKLADIGLILGADAVAYLKVKVLFEDLERLAHNGSMPARQILNKFETIYEVITRGAEFNS